MYYALSILWWDADGNATHECMLGSAASHACTAKKEVKLWFMDLQILMLMF